MRPLASWLPAGHFYGQRHAASASAVGCELQGWGGHISARSALLASYKGLEGILRCYWGNCLVFPDDFVLLLGLRTRCLV